MALVVQTIIIVFCIGYYLFDQQKKNLPFYDVSTKIHKKYHSSIQHTFKYNGTYPINTGRNMSIIEPFVLESSNGNITIDGINQLENFIPDSGRFKEKYVKNTMESSNSSMAEEIAYQMTKPGTSGFYQNEEFGQLRTKYHLWIDERIKMDDDENFDKAELAELFTSNSAISRLSHTLLRQNKKIEPIEHNGIHTSIIPAIFDCSSDDVDIKCLFFTRNKYDIQSMLKLQDWENILRITLSQLINDGYVGGKVTVLPSDKSFEILLKLGLALEPKALEDEYINVKSMKLRETILNEI